MIRSWLLVILTLVAVCLAFTGLSLVAAEEVAGPSYGDTTREQILATRERRKRQLKVMIEDAEKKLAEHSSGENVLAEKEKARLETQIDLFQRKIKSMEIELEDWVSLSTDLMAEFLMTVSQTAIFESLWPNRKSNE